MTKICTNSYVLKFVGGEPGQTRKCHYCRKMKVGGMLCVYPNCDCDQNDMVTYICPGCLKRGCEESESQWKSLLKRKRP